MFIREFHGRQKTMLSFTNFISVGYLRINLLLILFCVYSQELNFHNSRAMGKQQQPVYLEDLFKNMIHKLGKRNFSRSKLSTSLFTLTEKKLINFW